MRTILFVLIATLFFVPISYAEDNYCLKFDGINDYAQIPDSDNWTFGSDDFTIEFWSKWNSLATGTTALSQWFNENSNYYWEIDWYPTGQLWFSAFTAGPAVEFYCDFTPTIDQWYHIALVRNGTTQSDWHFFVNGVDQVPLTKQWGNWDGNLGNLSGPLEIGRRDYAYELLFDGAIDEFRVWDHARTQQELNDWKNYTLSGSEGGLLGYWNFNDPANIMKDLSPYGNNGQVYEAQYIPSDSPVSTIPEPSSFLLFGLGGIAAALIKKRKGLRENRKSGHFFVRHPLPKPE